jgi:hypothetical protein
VEETGR